MSFLELMILNVPLDLSAAKQFSSRKCKYIELAVPSINFFAWKMVLAALLFNVDNPQLFNQLQRAHGIIMLASISALYVIWSVHTVGSEMKYGISMVAKCAHTLISFKVNAHWD
jgi:hypothetical protein